MVIFHSILVIQHIFQFRFVFDFFLGSKTVYKIAYNLQPIELISETLKFQTNCYTNKKQKY